MGEQLERAVVVRLKRGALDKDFPIGIVRIMPDLTITYANHAAASMGGEETVAGRKLTDLVLSDSSRRILESQYRVRFEEQRSSSYTIRLTRPDTTVLRARVAAVPEYNEAGEISGSVGFIVDQSEEIASLRMYQAIQKSKDSKALLNRITMYLRSIVAFDTFLVVVISKDRNHLQRLFESPPPPEDVVPTKWFLMKPFVKRMTDQFKEGPIDLVRLFETPEFIEYVKTDPSFAHFKKRGYTHGLRLGVHEAGKLVATIDLMRKTGVPFTKQDLRRCRRVPLRDAVATTMRRDCERYLQFRLGLMQAVAGAANDIRNIATKLVDKLQEHYGWSHVSLFYVDERSKKLRVLYQARKCKHALPATHSQNFDEGLIGQAYSTGAAVNVGDVTDKQKAARYVERIPGTRSEMVLPVGLPGGKLRWLLNVESAEADAFVDEEESSVRELLQLVAVVLDRAATLQLKSAIFKSVADGVVHTDDSGVILEVNPAAAEMLRTKGDELRGRQLADYLRVQRRETGASTEREAAEELPDAATVMIQECWASTEAELMRPGRRPLTVLVSSAPLLEAPGGKVFVASDLTNRKKVERLEAVKEGLRQLASEIRMPIALAATFLADSDEPDADLKDLIKKAYKQTRKADLPLERILRLQAASEEADLPSAAVDLRASVKAVIEELPTHENRAVLAPKGNGTVVAEAAPDELQFCIQNALAYLLRVRSQKEKIDVQIGRYQSHAFITMSLTDVEGIKPIPLPADSAMDLTLVEPVLKGLMTRMGGEYKKGGTGFQFLLQKREGSHAAVDRS